MMDIVLHLLHLLVYLGNLYIQFLYIQNRYLPYRLLYKFEYILSHYLPLKQVGIFAHLCQKVLYHYVPVRNLILQEPVNPLLKEDLLQRVVVPVVLQLSHSNLQLFGHKLLCILRTTGNEVIHREEFRLLVLYDTGIYGNGYFAICKGIERIYCLVRRDVVGKVNHYLRILGGVVIYLLYLYLTLFVSLYYTLY